MNLLELILTSLSSLKTNRTRTILTMLGVVIGVTSVILLVSIGRGLQTYITKQLESLGGDSLIVMPGKMEIGTGGSQGGGMPGAGAASSKFTFVHLNQLKKQAETIKIAMAYTENNSTIKYKGKSVITQVAGVGAEYPSVRNQQLTSGSFFNQSQYGSAKKIVVLGKTVYEKLFGQKNPVGERITISSQQYLVVGVLEEKGAFGGIDLDNQVFIPATTAMRQFDMEYIQSLWIQSLNSDLVPKTKMEIEKILGQSLDKDEFSVIDTKSILKVVTGVMGVLTAALGGIAAISLIVGGVGIMNIMLVSVTERTREIGLRKALGATPKIIMSQFLIEAVVLSLGGGIIGILLGVSGAVFIGRFFTTQVTFGAIFLAFFVSAAIGIVFGVTPAVKAAKLNPIDALRYE